MNIRYLISAARIIRIPGRWTLMRDWSVFIRMHFLYAALESGLPEALQGGATRDAIFAQRGEW